MHQNQLFPFNLKEDLAKQKISSIRNHFFEIYLGLKTDFHSSPRVISSIEQLVEAFNQFESSKADLKVLTPEISSKKGKK